MRIRFFSLKAALMHLEMSADTTSTRVGFCMLELVALALSLDIAGASNSNL